MSYIIGAAQTAFGRFPESGLVDMGVEVLRAALADAGIDKHAIDGVVVANAFGAMLFGETTIGQSITHRAGLRQVPVFNVENACTSGSSAVHVGDMAIAAGQCDVVLVIGVEKMCVPQMGLINSGFQDLDTMLGLVAPASFALRAKRHMHEFGTTDRQLAAVAVKNRKHAALNPLAMFRKTESIESVLAAPMIVDPLTRPQCSPVADGAAALILSRGPKVGNSGRGRHVRLAASTLGSGSHERPPALSTWATDRDVAAKTYERAGIGPEDIDVLECHDAFSIAEILHIEALGLCPIGEGGRLTESGETALGGRIPVNVSGGLLSRGHPIAATAVAQFVELTRQLRGEAGARQVPGASVGLAHCMGGDIAGDTKSCTVAVLTA